METKQMKLTRKILKEMIEEVIKEAAPNKTARRKDPAQMKREKDYAAAVASKNPETWAKSDRLVGDLAVKNIRGISFIGNLMTVPKGSTGIPEDLKTKMLNDLSGSKILEAMAGYKLVYGEPTDEVELIFVALFHLNRAIKQSKGTDIIYGFNLLNYGGNYFTDVFNKISKRGRVILFDILRKAGLPLSKIVKDPNVAKHLSHTSRRKTSIPRKRVRKSASRYRNRAYVGAVQKIVNLFVKAGQIDTPLLTVDRSYGPKTRTGVKALQRKLGVKPDRYFGPKTACALSSLLQREYTHDSEYQTKDKKWRSENCKSPRWVITLAFDTALEDMLKRSKQKKKAGPPPFNKEDGKARQLGDLFGFHAAHGVDAAGRPLPPPPPKEKDAKRADDLLARQRAQKQRR